MTNFEKLKEEIDSMSVRHFASCFGDFICKYIPQRVCNQYKTPYQCYECRINWLKGKKHYDKF